MPLDIPSHGCLLARNEVCLCPDPNLNHPVSLKLGYFDQIYSFNIILITHEAVIGKVLNTLGRSHRYKKNCSKLWVTIKAICHIYPRFPEWLHNTSECTMPQNISMYFISVYKHYFSYIVCQWLNQKWNVYSTFLWLWPFYAFHVILKTDCLIKTLL